MTARLVIHLGDHKTGSTSIQAALRACSETGASGVFYPSEGNHNGLAKALIRGGGADERFAAVARRLAASDAETGVISAERFEAAAPARLLRAIERHFPEHLATLRLIAYVRPHAERVLSSYAERIKGGHFSGTLAAFHDKTEASGEFRYLPRFLAWRETFGARFHLRPMIRDRLKDGDVVADFLDFALDGAPVRLDRSAPSNPSLSLQDLSLLREMQAVLAQRPAITSERRNMAGWRLAARLAAAPAEGTRPALDPALAAGIRAAYAEDAAALDAAFFEGGPMQAALIAVAAGADKAQSIDARDHHDEPTIRRIRALSELLAELLDAPAAGGKRKRSPW